MTKVKSELKKAWSVTDVIATEHETIAFSNEFYQAFGTPAPTGVWFIYGNSGNGKTRFQLQLAKELGRFYKGVINSLEEGNSLTMKTAFIETGMQEVNKKVQLIKEPMDDASIRLSKHKSPHFIMVDSWQYTFWTFKQYLEFKEKHKDKLIIIVSQANGKMPKGRTAESVMYDADLKIWVEGFRAYSKGRFFGPRGYFTIWHEGAARYYGAA